MIKEKETGLLHIAFLILRITERQVVRKMGQVIEKCR